MHEQPMLHLKVKPFILGAKDWSGEASAHLTGVILSQRQNSFKRPRLLLRKSTTGTWQTRTGSLVSYSFICNRRL